MDGYTEKKRSSRKSYKKGHSTLKSRMVFLCMSNYAHYATPQQNKTIISAVKIRRNMLNG